MERKSNNRSPTVDWKKLKVRGGSATEVPRLVARMAEGDDHSLQFLDDGLSGDGEWYSASAPAAQLLLETFGGKGTARHRAGWVLADVLCGKHVRVTTRDFDPESFTAKDARAVRAVVVESPETIVEAIGDSDPPMRAAAALVAGMLSELAADLLPRLKEQAASESDPAVLATQIVAMAVLARLSGDGKVGPTLHAFRDARKAGLVRGAAAYAELLLETKKAKVDFESVVQDLGAGIGADVDPAKFPWSRGNFAALLDGVMPKGAAAAKASLARAVIASIAPGAQPTTWDRVSPLLLELAGFKERWDEQDIALVEELNPLQRGVAEALAKRDGIQAVGWGLPPSGRDRRRWLGIAPAGPLEKVIETTIDKKKFKSPLWKVWQTLYARELTTEGIPEAARSKLTPLETLEAVTEIGLNAYRIAAQNGSVAASAQEVAELVAEAGPAAAAWAERRADEFAQVLEHPYTPECNNSDGVSEEVQFALMLPIVRAKTPIAPRWKRLIPWTTIELARPVLERVAPELREEIVFEGLSVVPEPEMEGGLDVGVPVLEFAPSKRNADILLGKLKNQGVRQCIGDDLVNQYLDVIQSVAKKHAGVKQALDAVGGVEGVLEDDAKKKRKKK